MELDPADLQRMLTHGEEQLHSLRSNLSLPDDAPELLQRIEAMEARLDLQEEALKHTLRMVIEFIERQA